MQALHPLSLISARLIHVSGRVQHIQQLGGNLDNRNRPTAYRLIQLFGVLAVFTQIGSELLWCIAVPAGLGDTYRMLITLDSVNEQQSSSPFAAP